MNVTRFRRFNCLALLAAFTLAFTPQFARADDQVPFVATFGTQFTAQVVPPFLNVSVTGLGQARHMGATSAVTTNQAVSLITGIGTADYTLTAANGDTVVLHMVLNTIQGPGGVTFQGPYTVTGGTGRFSGATGSGIVTGSAAFTGPTSGVGTFTVAGTISSPGSLK